MTHRRNWRASLITTCAALYLFVASVGTAQAQFNRGGTTSNNLPQVLNSVWTWLYADVRPPFCGLLFLGGSACMSRERLRPYGWAALTGVGAIGIMPSMYQSFRTWLGN